MGHYPDYDVHEQGSKECWRCGEVFEPSGGDVQEYPLCGSKKIIPYGERFDEKYDSTMNPFYTKPPPEDDDEYEAAVATREEAADLPGFRVVEGKVFRANIERSGPLAIEICAEFDEPVIIDAEFRRVPGELPHLVRRIGTVGRKVQDLDELLKDQM
jgi:hypothetical protein